MSNNTNIPQPEVELDSFNFSTPAAPPTGLDLNLISSYPSKNNLEGGLEEDSILEEFTPGV